MSVAAKRKPRAGVAELLAIPEDERFHEILDGELVRKAMPSGPHGLGQSQIVAGWRRERMPEVPQEAPISQRPDWICEVLSRSNARNDLVKKMRVYRRAAVPHYWIVDPDRETLTVYRWTTDGYLMAVMAEPSDRVRAEPFGDVELDVRALFGDEEA